MKKAIGQTVRELKREVNKKVLKVPGIEQKILDATSNEPWGPHGSLLADIAMATRNYHEYQMIMAVVWKRISDTGKNWRHVYKGLIVLEYLVANGSERVIDDIREHAYQISALSEFQYIDSSGRDQGNNVRRKSQSLVALVNDKEKIAEVRQKAAANRDKFRNTSGGGMYRPGGYGDRYDYDRYEGRYGSRDEDQNGYGNGREREYSYKDDERYRYGDSYNRDGDRYGRDDEDHYGRDNYRDDDHRGRSTDDHQDRTRSRSSDRDRAYDDNGSSRGGGVRTEDYSQDGRQFEQKSPEQNGGAPPSYEEAVNDTRSPAYNERNGETLAATAPTASSPPGSYSQSPQTTPFGDVSATVNQGTGAVDEFDPRSAASAAQDSAGSSQTAVAPAAATTSTVTEVDFLGSLSDSFSSPLAIVPTASAGPTVQAFAASEAPSTASNQAFDNPFGDGPFKAAPSTGTVPVQEKASTDAASSSHVGVNGGFDQPFAGQSESISNFAFRDSFSAVSHSSSNVSNGQPPSTSSQVFPQELSAPHQEPDILADILPLSGSLDAVASQAPLPGPTAHFPGPHSQPAQSSANAYGQPTQPGTDMFARPAQPTDNPYGQPPQAPIPYSQPQQPTANPYGQPAHVTSYGQQMQPLSNPYSQQPQPSGNPYGQPAQSTINPYVQQPQPSANPHGQSAQPNSDMFGNSNQQPGLLALPAPNIASQPSQGSVAAATSNVAHPQSSTGPSSANFLPQQAYQSPTFSQNAQPVTNASASQEQNDALGDLFSANNSAAPQPPPKPSKDKFEPKSAVWADTLSRGLVNLNISGPKTNPLADIGVDFDAINRKERRLEKPAATPVMSTVTMGKAMGSGSGMGRTGVSTLRSQPNPMMGSSGMGMVMGMGVRPGAGMGMGMGGYGGVNQQPMGMGMGMNMGMGMPKAVHMQPPMGMPPGSAMPSGYSPMMGSGGYAPQQPYGGGY